MGNLWWLYESDYELYVRVKVDFVLWNMTIYTSVHKTCTVLSSYLQQLRMTSHLQRLGKSCALSSLTHTSADSQHSVLHYKDHSSEVSIIKDTFSSFQTSHSMSLPTLFVLSLSPPESQSHSAPAPSLTSFSLSLFFSPRCPLQLENLGNFIKAILAYGLKPNDIFEANDLFENGNMTQVQTTLLALASMVSEHTSVNKVIVYWGSVNTLSRSLALSQAKTKGMDTKIDIGVKYADKQARHFDNEKIKAGQCVIGLQVTTVCKQALLISVGWHQWESWCLDCSF